MRAQQASTPSVTSFVRTMDRTNHRFAGGGATHFKGSSRIAGKDALDLHEKEFAIPVTVRHPLNDLYSIVYSFQLLRVHRPANPTYDAPRVSL